MNQETMTASKAWPFVEATALLGRIGKNPPTKGYVLFETGYGPSGLPHIGTFAEVFRTTLIRHAFSLMSDLPTELFAFSDDMDGLRKVPDNVPNAAMVGEYLQKPLTSIPDPFGTHESYGAHMNARLRAFLDAFGFDYTFKSATECYRAGLFDEVLLRVLERHEAICNVVKPHLGEERRATYSPVLPISPRTGRVLQVPLEETRPESGTVVFRDEDGSLQEVPVTGGSCKLQWRADWALRWTALEVDYEMSGKDLIDSVRLGGQICRIMGGTPPNNLTYELFLDQNGEKISKSRGNGLTIEEWLHYATKESLQLFLYQSPKKAKRLYFDVIPRQVDDYQAFIDAFAAQEDDKKLGNPVWHIHAGDPPSLDMPVSFSMLLNLAAVVNADEPSVLWSFIRRYAPDCTPDNNPGMAKLVDGAIAYYRDMIAPNKVYRGPDERERAALADLRGVLAGLPDDADAKTIQNEVYEIGRTHGFDNLRDWFRALYEILLGQSEGPRFGSFVEIYGKGETVALIDTVLEKGTPARDG
ncbi:MAG: lysine--tRNA ligase [Geminicoccaceae bacterium]|nr:lysine--tRNA ligase [Geminicoccaceae bacterium]